MTDWRNRIVGHGEEDPAQLLANPGNYRRHPRYQQEAMKGALAEVGWIDEVIVNRVTGHVVNGHMRVEIAMREGATSVPVRYVELTEEEERVALATFDPLAALAVIDEGALAELRSTTTISDRALAALAGGRRIEVEEEEVEEWDESDYATVPASSRGALVDRFVVPPFTILDTRQGYWRDRRQQWVDLGIRSEIGRTGRASPDDLMLGEVVKGGRPPHGPTVRRSADGRLVYQASNVGEGACGVSIFDPVLCEIAYRWFCRPGGIVLDPFAGGSVRGIVAVMTGRRYVGIDLSEAQIAANIEQGRAICGDDAPIWRVGDALDVRRLAGDEAPYDFLWTCPPYADLEVYSDDPRDLSTMDYPQFVRALRSIIADSVALLADDTFAGVVVSEVRDRHGFYRNLVSDTISAFIDAGVRYYNEAILINAIGSLPVRIAHQFMPSRKLGRCHQTVLVFVKGDPRAASAAIGDVDIGDLEGAE